MSKENPIISKEMMEAMVLVYWSHHPNGSWEDFDKRLEWCYDQMERSIECATTPSPILAWLKSKGNIKSV